MVDKCRNCNTCAYFPCNYYNQFNVDRNIGCIDWSDTIPHTYVSSGTNCEKANLTVDTQYEKEKDKKQAEWPEWEDIVFCHDKAIPFKIEELDENKIPGQTKENPSILNIKYMKEDPLYYGLKKHVGEVVNVENEDWSIKCIKIVEE